MTSAEQKALKEFITETLRTLAAHKVAIERLAENDKIAFENVRQLTEQVNHHREILSALDSEVKRRLGFTTDPAPGGVN